MKNSLTYLKGNIFSSSAEVIVNPVNTFGVMGKGLAAEFKRRYPDMFRKYKAFCEQKKFSVGQLYISREVDYAVLLFPTKKHWRKPSRIEYVEAGLKKFVDTCEEKGIKSIAFPKLGCGYGGLDWNDVRPLMEKYLRELPIEIYIYLDNEQDSNSGAVVALHNDFSIAGVFAALSEFLKKNSLLEFGGENYTVTLKSKSLRFDDGARKFMQAELICPNEFVFAPSLEKIVCYIQGAPSLENVVCYLQGETLAGCLKKIVCRNEVEARTLINLLRARDPALVAMYECLITTEQEFPFKLFERNGLFIKNFYFDSVNGKTVIWINFSNTPSKQNYDNAKIRENSACESSGVNVKVQIQEIIAGRISPFVNNYSTSVNYHSPTNFYLSSLSSGLSQVKIYFDDHIAACVMCMYPSWW